MSNTTTIKVKNSIKSKHSIDEAVEMMKNKGCKVNVNKTNFTSTRSYIIFTCDKHEYKGEQSIRFDSLYVNNFYCKHCKYEHIGNQLRGENNPNWVGGYTDINLYLRNYLNQWKKDCIELYNYKCAITKTIKI